MKNDKYNVIGLMSGTSLDGLDIALCNFTKSNKTWKYEIKNTQTVSYNNIWKEKLQNAHLLSAQDFWQLHIEFGKFMGEKVSQFIKKNKTNNIDLISSHGHTIFHQPQKHFTCQVGDGASIAALTGIKTVCDFRSTDVALGGQGAPLVPVGDELLFSDFDACLNIGGISNISFKNKGKRVAFDICPANILFNYLAKQAGHDYDKGGKLASYGIFDGELFQKFNSFPFYKNYKSKSLGREWIEENFISELEKSRLSLHDKLATVSEHAAFQTARVLNNFKIKNILVTGGGAYNEDFLTRVGVYTNFNLHLPNDKTIQFKEALVFAFLGVLRLRNEINSLKEVTGAKKSSCGGAVYL